MSKPSKRRYRRIKRSTRLAPESLEDRRVMTTFMVTSPDAVGSSTLSHAIAQANSNPGHDVIAFSENIDFETISTSGTLAITDSVTVQGNGADRTIVDGGGTHQLFNIDQPAGSIDVEFSGLTIQNGRTSVGDPILGGGAIRSVEQLTVSDAYLANNYSEGSGGAINQLGASLSIINTTIANNEAGEFGGGIWAQTGSELFELTGSTVSNNGSGRSGGGVWLSANNQGQIDHATIVQNTAGLAGGDVSGGIHLTGSGVEVANSIIAENQDTLGTAPNLNQGVTPNAFFYSILSNNSGSGVTASAMGMADANGNFVGTSAETIDAGIGLLRDNGGPMPTHELSSASPAIDSANPALGGDWTVMDQRGAPRNVDYAYDGDSVVRRDMGALESYRLGFVFEVNTLADEVDGLFSGVSLREAILGLEYDRSESSIRFSQSMHGGTIELTLGELEISESVEIDGPGASRMTIQSATDDRVFNIEASPYASTPMVELSGMTMKGGTELQGGVINSINADLRLDGAVVTGGHAAFSGGGIYARGGSLGVVASTLHDNSASNGGAIYAADMDGVFPVSVVLSTISGNNANQSGGGVFVRDLTGTLPAGLFQRTTITNNNASTTGGVEAINSNLAFDGSIVSANGGGLFRDARASGGSVGAGYTLFGDGNGTGLSPTFGPDTNGNLVGTSIIYLTPGLEPLGDNGGQTPTHQPLPFSRVIDAGEPGADREDQRGILTPIDGDIDSSFTVIEDMGAVEFVPDVPMQVDVSNDIVNGDVSPGDLSLREAIMLSNVLPGAATIDFADHLDSLSPTSVMHIFDSVNIVGPGADQLTIDAQSNDRIFWLHDDSFYNAIDVTMEGMTLTGGFASDANGGGAIHSRENLTLQGMRVTDNFADTASGGIAGSVGSLRVFDSTIDNNSTSGSGGGVTTFTLLDEAEVEFRNVTISSNAAAGDGGGLYLSSLRNRPATLEHVTVANNTSDVDRNGMGNGGGIHAAVGDIVLRNSIVAANAKDDVHNDINLDTSFTYTNLNADYSLVGTNEGSGLSESVLDANGNIIGGPIGGSIDPQLGVLTDNGGSTPTHALTSASPGYNMGDPAARPAIDVTESDQRGLGYGRVYHGRTDMGAFELQPPAIDGDFNGDGLYTCSDIDSLVAEIAAGTHRSIFDLNHDELVTLRDRDLWLAEAGANNLPSENAYRIGDANLDGVVDGADFVVWNINKFTTNAGWCTGDFNADGFVDGQDFVLWNSNKFQASDSTAARHEPLESPKAENPSTFTTVSSAIPLREINRFYSRDHETEEQHLDRFDIVFAEIDTMAS